MKPVVDANVLIHGRGNYRFNEAYTVPDVMNELKSAGSRVNLNVLDIDTMDPSQESLEEVKSKSEEINSPTSEADEKVVALAEDLNTDVISDDRAVQNLAAHLGIGFQGFMDDRIDKKFTWKIVCGNCGRKMDGERCSACGASSPQRKLDQYNSL